jgi:hypothetical protein
VSTFADAEVIRMAKNEFIPVAGDDWYQRRKDDTEGEFFRKVADQGPRKGDGGSTRQGIYVFTADGKLLGYRNHHDADVMRTMLKQALAEFKKLPEEKRRPGAIKVEDQGKVDKSFDRKPPQGGLIVNVYTRILDDDPASKGDYCQGTCNVTGGDRAAHDHLWLTEVDWKALIPQNASKGDTMLLPPKVAMRLLRFHMVDNTRGEPPHWSTKEIRQQTLKLTVAEVTAKEVVMKLDGSALLTTDADPAKAKRGYDVSILATIRYDVEKKTITRIDGVALGLHWGAGPYTGGARPGRTPLGIAFELATGDAPANRVPPQGSRFLRGYLEADRE